jgi:hypothetical protein
MDPHQDTLSAFAQSENIPDPIDAELALITEGLLTGDHVPGTAWPWP